MKKITVISLAMLLLTSCNGWFFQPSPYNPPTPFLPPTNTPSIHSPTPVIIGVNSATPMVATATTIPSNTPFVPFTNTPLVIATNTATQVIATASVDVELLGCSTSIDVSHGMGEVTDAYVTLKNTGNVDLTNIKATVFALDEGREHPDKTVELTSLPVNYQVSIKLTADSTYREETPIQIEVTADNNLFQRIGEASCRDIGLFAPRPDGLMTPVPVNP
jgi:hypothetical protein